MPKLDLAAAPIETGSDYPPPYAAQMAGRSSLRLGELAGLTHFGVNIATIQPGGVASLRHWHLREDEFAMVLDGDLILVEDLGETAMTAGDCAAWKAGRPDGHRFVNRSDRPARFLIVGSEAPDDVMTYADVDMTLTHGCGQPRFTHHDGSDWTGPRDIAPNGETE